MELSKIEVAILTTFYTRVDDPLYILSKLYGREPLNCIPRLQSLGLCKYSELNGWVVTYEGVRRLKDLG